MLLQSPASGRSRGRSGAHKNGALWLLGRFSMLYRDDMCLRVLHTLIACVMMVSAPVFLSEAHAEVRCVLPGRDRPFGRDTGRTLAGRLYGSDAAGSGSGNGQLFQYGES